MANAAHRNAFKNPPYKSRRVLLIDDCRETLALVRHLVGVAVPEAKLAIYDATRGLPKDLSRPYKLDLILLALHSTGEPRFDWLKALAEISNAPPMVILTDIEDAELQRHALALGAADHMTRRQMTVSAFAERIQNICTTRRHTPPITGVIEIKRGFTPGAGTKPVRKMVARSRKIKPRQRTISAPEVSGYEDLQEIGHGGMATVYLARHQGEQVVLKILHVGGEENEVFVRRFLREFRIAARLVHPNIVRIYERAFASDFAYIAMEYCSGGDLSQKIMNGMGVDEVVECTRSIAKALGAAHGAGITHRDVKPENVLFRADGSVALSDFGIAKAKEGAVSLTRTNALVGTPHYISPEQVRGAPIDHRADIYSLGVLMYEMLAGHRPYRADRLIKLLNAHLYAPIPELPDNATHLQPVLDKLLAKKPGGRYQTAQELASALP